jgi:mitogen-activated protein kinase 15
MSKVEDLEPHILDKYNIIQRLGKGAYGVVWRAINKETKSEVAIKKVMDGSNQIGF